MNAHQRHKLEYLLDRLDDEDIGEAGSMLVELGESRRRGYHIVESAQPLLPITRRLFTLLVFIATTSVISLMAAYHLALVVLAAPLVIFYSAVALLLRTRAPRLI